MARPGQWFHNLWRGNCLGTEDRNGGRGCQELRNAVNRAERAVCVGLQRPLDFRVPMKSERRHDLETNDLAKKIIQAPDYFKTYGGQIALVVIVAVAVALLVNYRIRSKRANLSATEEGLA